MFMTSTPPVGVVVVRDERWGGGVERRPRPRRGLGIACVHARGGRAGGGGRAARLS